jgi:hypothetical protein
VSPCGVEGRGGPLSRFKNRAALMQHGGETNCWNQPCKVVNVERIVAELGIIGTRGVRRREGGRRKKEGEVSSKEEVERYHGL